MLSAYLVNKPGSSPSVYTRATPNNRYFKVPRGKRDLNRYTISEWPLKRSKGVEPSHTRISWSTGRCFYLAKALGGRKVSARASHFRPSASKILLRRHTPPWIPPHTHPFSITTCISSLAVRCTPTGVATCGIDGIPSMLVVEVAAAMDLAWSLGVPLS
jgi:hypothetical protein